RLEHRPLASVDDGFSESFSKTSLPVGTLVPMSQIRDHEPSSSNLDAKTVIDEAGHWLFVQTLEVEACLLQCRCEAALDDLVENGIPVGHRHECGSSLATSSPELLDSVPAIEREHHHGTGRILIPFQNSRGQQMLHQP